MTRKSERILWRDIWHAAEFSYTSNNDGRILWIDWKLYEVMGWQCQDDGDEDTWPALFTRDGANCNMDADTTLDGAETLAEGFIKWDGCMQFTTGHMHLDDMVNVDNFAEALRRIRDKAVELTGADVDRQPRKVSYRAEVLA